MIVKSEITSLYDFDAWSGGNDTKNTLIKAGKQDEAWNFIEEQLGGEATDTEINDFLWFEREQIFKNVGLDENGEEIKEEDEETEETKESEENTDKETEFASEFDKFKKAYREMN